MKEINISYIQFLQAYGSYEKDERTIVTLIPYHLVEAGICKIVE